MYPLSLETFGLSQNKSFGVRHIDLDKAYILSFTVGYTGTGLRVNQ